MTDGYEPWIAIAPEGKFPVRTGAGAPARRSTPTPGPAMDVGVDTKAPLSKFYGQDVIDALTQGTDTLARWAIPQGQGDLLGAIQGEQPVANAVNEVSNGDDPADAAAKAADAIRDAADVRCSDHRRTHRAGPGDGGSAGTTRLRRRSGGAVRPGTRGPPDRATC